MSIDDMTETQMRNILKEIESYIEPCDDWGDEVCCLGLRDSIFETLRDILTETFPYNNLND
jgi:hypothetical protein